MDFAFASALVAGGRNLEVIALNENRAPITFLDGRGQDAGSVLHRPLIRVADLAAGDLEQHRAHVVLVGSAKDGARRVVVHGPNVHRRDGEGSRHIATADSHVQLVDRRRVDAQSLGDLPDQPAGGVTDKAVAEDSRLNQAIDFLAQRRFVAHGNYLAVNSNGAIEVEQ